MKVRSPNDAWMNKRSTDVFGDSTLCDVSDRSLEWR